jgi:hypothetical protein
LEIALLCYLAVAHYGRGRGEWQDSEPPALWRQAVRDTTAAHRRGLDRLWKAAGNKQAPAESLRHDARKILTTCTMELLRRLYPRVRLDWLEG